MSPADIVTMLRRQLFAALAICFIAAASCLYLIHENPGYTDSGQIVFRAPEAWGLNGAFADGKSLLVIEEVTGWYLMGSAGQQAVRHAGGTAPYAVAFYNAYNEEYPNYSQPYFTVTASSKNPAATQSTFTAVLTVLEKNLKSRQLAAGSSPVMLSMPQVISGPTGPVIQRGSPKRTLGGFALLTVVALISITWFLDRRGFRGPRLFVLGRVERRQSLASPL